MTGYEMIICVIKYNVVIMFDNCSIQYKAIVTAPSLLSDAGVRTGPRPGEGELLSAAIWLPDNVLEYKEDVGYVWRSFY